MSARKLTIRKLRASEVTFEVIVEAEQDQVSGHFATGDDDLDRKLEREIVDTFNAGNVEAWCMITVKATWEGFEGVDHLGCCSHLPGEGLPSLDKQVEQTVSEHGMRENALADLNQEVQRQAAKCLAIAQRLTVKPRGKRKGAK